MRGFSSIGEACLGSVCCREGQQCSYLETWCKVARRNLLCSNALQCEMALLLDGMARGAVRYLGFVYATGKTCDHALLLARTVLVNQRLQHNAVRQYSWHHWVSHLP